MITTISFDVDGTLMKSTFPDAFWLEGVPQLFAKEKQITVEEAKTILFKSYDEVGHHQIEWYDPNYWFQRFRLKGDWKHLLHQYRYAVEPYPEVQKIIKRLAKKYTLAIISNAKREFIDIQLEETQLTPYFSYVFSMTSEYQNLKNSAHLYAMICKRMSVTSDELIHIGDHEEFDYKIPRKIGITSFYLDRTKIHQGEFVVADLKMFEKKLNTL